MKRIIPMGLAIALIFITGMRTMATAPSNLLKGTMMLNQAQPDCNPKEEKECR